MQLYMSWYIISFFGFTFLNIFIFSSTLVLTFSYRRNLYTFYLVDALSKYIFLNGDIVILMEILPRLSIDEKSAFYNGFPQKRQQAIAWNGGGLNL